MSHHVHHPTTEVFDQKHAGKVPLILIVASVVGIAISVLGAVRNPEQFAYSWLFAFIYFFTLCVGCLFWTMVHHATDAEWSVVLRRLMENVAVLIPIMSLFFIPLAFNASTLWKWWSIPVGVDELLDGKRTYLNHTFFFARVLFYFGGLSMLAYLFKRHSTEQDVDSHPKHTISMRRLSFLGIPLFAVSLTFGAFDWLMGLDYKWFSTMWGVYIFAGAAGSSMSLLVLVLTWLRVHGYYKHSITHEHYHIMGKLMLAFVVFWAYIGFSQYMLIWYANIPEETTYFIRRNIGSWNTLSLALVVGRFFIPFLILLLQSTKKAPRALCMVAGWILCMQLLDMYIIVMPMLHKEGFAPSLYDLGAILAVGAPLAYLFLKRLGKHSLIPVGDPRIDLCLKLSN
jgi:hypothetical protein